MCISGCSRDSESISVREYLPTIYTYLAIYIYILYDIHIYMTHVYVIYMSYDILCMFVCVWLRKGFIRRIGSCDYGGKDVPQKPAIYKLKAS